MDGVLGSVVIVVVAQALAIGITLVLGWLIKDSQPAERTWFVQLVFGEIGCLIGLVIAIAAAVAVRGDDMSGFNGEPVVRIAFALTGAVGFVIALLVNKKVMAWPIWMVIAAYAICLAVIVLILAATWLLPPIQPLFPPKL